MHTVSIPEWETPVGLSVVPDVLSIAISARVESVGPSRSVAALQEASKVLAARLANVHLGCQVVPRRLSLGGAGVDKSDKVDRADVQLDAVVHVPLEAGLDLWSRAWLAAQAVEALSTVAAEVGKHKPSVKLGWREPVARVLDVEPHRATLMAVWNSRVRSLLDGLATVEMSASWEAPIEVVQTSVSLQEVRLTLGSGARGR
jgi:hypothetical protein